MHAKVVTAQFRPGKMDEAIGVYRDSLTPALQQQKGFKGVLFLTDHNTSKSISVILWETKADMAAGESNAYVRQQFAKFEAIVGETFAGQTFEVSVQA